MLIRVPNYMMKTFNDPEGNAVFWRLNHSDVWCYYESDENGNDDHVFRIDVSMGLYSEYKNWQRVYYWEWDIDSGRVLVYTDKKKIRETIGYFFQC